MSTELPPSKFVAGYSYGGPVQPPQQPPAGAGPASSSPQVPTNLPPHAGSHDHPTYSAASSPNPHSPPPSSYAGPVQYPSTSGNYAAAAPVVSSAGTGGTAILASVLSFVGAVWQGLGAIGAAFTLLGLIQLLRASTSYGFGAASSGTLLMVAIYSGAQILAPILLLAGGVQLLRHHASGRRLITVGCLLVLVLRAFEGLAFYGVFQWMTGLFGSDAVTSDVYGEFAKAGLIVVALPALLAVVTMLFTASPATRNWCQSTHPAPHAGHIAY